MNARRTAALAGAAAMVGLLVVTAIVAALFGASTSCLGDTAGATLGGTGATRAAAREIPAARLHIYMGAARRFDLSWPFLASIGVQECGTDGTCAEVNPSGCAGAMQIAYVRGSACSPDPSAPTLWERFEVDADGGGADIFDPADSIYTAAHIFRADIGAPPAGGSYHGYYEAACSYYGACADAATEYAHEVMARAIEFGLGHEGRESRGSSPGGPSCGAGTRSGPGVASGAAIVRIARSQLGTSEFPPGSNCTKYGPCEEWCALFVAWVWEKAGVGLEGGTAPYAYSGSFYSWVKGHGGRDLPRAAAPAPGDAVMFGTGPNDSAHVGIVESVFGDEITTIDGNYGDRVARVGPFPVSAAVLFGEPGAIWAYAEPPGAGLPEGVGR